MLANWIDQLVFRELLLWIDFLFANLCVDCLTNLLVFVIFFVMRAGAIKCAFKHVQLTFNIEMLRPCIVTKSMPKLNKIIKLTYTKSRCILFLFLKESIWSYSIFSIASFSCFLISASFSASSFFCSSYFFFCYLVWRGEFASAKDVYETVGGIDNILFTII
jgi:hypothetical protein